MIYFTVDRAQDAPHVHRGDFLAFIRLFRCFLLFAGAAALLAGCQMAGAAEPAMQDRTYDIRDLLNIPVNYNAVPHLGLESEADRRAYAAATLADAETNSPSAQKQAREQRRAELVNWIAAVVRPDAPQSAVSAQADDSISVKAPAAAQAQVESLLENARQRLNMKFMIETRLLVMPDLLSHMPTDDPDLCAKIRLAYVPSRPQVSVGNEQVDKLLERIQSTVGDSWIAAPRITLWNNQRTYVLVATEHPYLPNENGAKPAKNAVSEVQTYETGILEDLRASGDPDADEIALNCHLEAVAAPDDSGKGAPRHGLPRLSMGVFDRTVAIKDEGYLVIALEPAPEDLGKFVKSPATQAGASTDALALLGSGKPTLLLLKVMKIPAQAAQKAGGK